MFFSASNALFWVEKIIALALIFQTLELIKIRETTKEEGIWKWSVLKEEFSIFPSALQRILGFLLKYPNFLLLLLVRLICAVLILGLSHSVPTLVLLFSTILIALRWRGTFNGGSDYMTIVILTALGLAVSFRSNFGVVFGCLWYITLQVCASYFIAGVVKLRRANWRSGLALRAFLNSTIYEPQALLQAFSKNALLVRLSSWLIIAFEISFPLALFNPTLCLMYIALAFLFHLANCYVFGLNRFLLAWAAGYPALLYCSQIRFS